MKLTIKNLTAISGSDGVFRLYGLDKDDVSDGYHTIGELYEHRYALFLALCHMSDYARSVSNDIDRANFPRSWKSKLHADGTMFEDSFIIGLGIASGKTITYHFPLSMWDLALVEEIPNAPLYDGHTPADTIKRLLLL